MPEGSSSAAPVTSPGPSRRNKTIARFAGDFFGATLEEFNQANPIYLVRATSFQMPCGADWAALATS